MDHDFTEFGKSAMKMVHFASAVAAIKAGTETGAILTPDECIAMLYALDVLRDGRTR